MSDDRHQELIEAGENAPRDNRDLLAESVGAWSHGDLLRYAEHAALVADVTAMKITTMSEIINRLISAGRECERSRQGVFRHIVKLATVMNRAMSSKSEAERDKFLKLVQRSLAEVVEIGAPPMDFPEFRGK
jgi:hypothetical protein